MVKKHNIRLIKQDYSYTTEQIADVLGVDVATVRRWIRDDGLERIPKVRPHLVHSSALRRFLEKKHAKQKKPCASDEMFCLRCQLPRQPLPHSASAENVPNGSIRIKAKCSVCDGKMNRAVKGEEWSEKHPLAKFLRDALIEHNEAQLMHRICSLQEEETL